MKIEKANWQTEGDSLRMSMPLQKVDTEKRIVSGFATLDNPDLHGDVVTKEASKKAFDRFRGNIRLMHQPIPAGKLVNFREEEYYDPKTQKFYSGVYVDAYISKGAADVWEMVTDGTLTGFSIGGNVIDAKSEFVKDAGKTVRFITDYEMVELSLVDNPANQLSNIFSIQKTADGQQVEGMLAKVNVENVFYCKKGHDPVAVVGEDTEKTCVDCGSDMKNIGWYESDGGDRAEKVNSIIAEFESTEGGENMAKKDEEVKTVEEVSPKGDDEVVAPEGEETKDATEVEVSENETVTVTGTGEKQVEEAKEVVSPETPDGEVKENPLVPKKDEEDEDIAKMLDNLSKSIGDSINRNAEKHSEELKAATESFEKQLGELATKHDELSNKFGSLTEKINGVEKRFESINESVAMSKSVDGSQLGDTSSSMKKGNGMWRGSIFSD